MTDRKCWPSGLGWSMHSQADFPSLQSAVTVLAPHIKSAEGGAVPLKRVGPNFLGMICRRCFCTLA